MYAHTFMYMQRQKLFVLLIPRQVKERLLCVFQYPRELQRVEWNRVEQNRLE